MGWQGLPQGCTSEALFGVPLDETWGALPLGEAHLRARSRLLELAGYGRPLAYVRDGHVIAFDGMSPDLAEAPDVLDKSLGPPEWVRDWIFGTVRMPAGERVYASRGISLFTNPETHAIVYVTLFAPTTVDHYRQTLRPPREKRSLPKP